MNDTTLTPTQREINILALAFAILPIQMEKILEPLIEAINDKHRLNLNQAILEEGRKNKEDCAKTVARTSLDFIKEIRKSIGVGHIEDGSLTRLCNVIATLNEYENSFERLGGGETINMDGDATILKQHFIVTIYKEGSSREIQAIMVTDDREKIKNMMNNLLGRVVVANYSLGEVYKLEE